MEARLGCSLIWHKACLGLTEGRGGSAKGRELSLTFYVRFLVCEGLSHSLELSREGTDISSILQMRKWTQEGRFNYVTLGQSQNSSPALLIPNPKTQSTTISCTFSATLSEGLRGTCSLRKDVLKGATPP